MIEVCKELYREELRLSFRGGRQAETLAPAGRMPAARAPIRKKGAKLGSAPMKSSEGQEVKPVLIPFNAVTASKSVSKENDS